MINILLIYKQKQKIKWCAWLSVLCSFIGFANAKAGDDTKQVLSCFMLSISSVVMSYLQNPTPSNKKLITNHF
jgi:hypothetical protein